MRANTTDTAITTNAVPYPCSIDNSFLNEGKYEYVLVAIAVTKAVIINEHVATKERRRSDDKPQTPWPLVQPLPFLVPKPTRIPPMTKRSMGTVDQS